MQIIIFSFLSIVIVAGGLWDHDVRHPPEEQARERRRKQTGIQDGTLDRPQEQLVGEPILDKGVALAVPVKTKGEV